jgi:hypothetical protein
MAGTSVATGIVFGVPLDAASGWDEQAGTL